MIILTYNHIVDLLRQAEMLKLSQNLILTNLILTFLYVSENPLYDHKLNILFFIMHI